MQPATIETQVRDVSECEYRAQVAIKGKVEMDRYVVLGER
jgi:hypothetical protein